MNHCVVIHVNGTSEVVDVMPRVHRELRGLGYRRFVIRTADGRSPLSSALYARTIPSLWQVSDAARKLWGRNTTAVHLFDEHGEPLEHDGTSRMTTGEMRVIDAPVTDEYPVPAAAIAAAAVPAVPTPQPAPAAKQPPVVTREMLSDLRLGAREIRGLLASRPVGLSEANQLRALADRLEVHAKALEALLPR
jgi:hypothetical protein